MKPEARTMPNLRADEDHEDDVRDFLRRRKLSHLRVRRRSDVLTLESGPETTLSPTFACAACRSTSGPSSAPLTPGASKKTFLGDQLDKLLSEVQKTMSWVLAPLD